MAVGARPGPIVAAPAVDAGLLECAAPAAAPRRVSSALKNARWDQCRGKGQRAEVLAQSLSGLRRRDQQNVGQAPVVAAELYQTLDPGPQCRARRSGQASLVGLWSRGLTPPETTASSKEPLV